MSRQDKEITEGTARRDEMSAQGIRGLLLLNGGGAVALLAFLQQSWSTAPSLVPFVTYGLIPLLFGAASAVAVHFFRFEASLSVRPETL